MFVLCSARAKCIIFLEASELFKSISVPKVKKCALSVTEAKKAAKLLDVMGRPDRNGDQHAPPMAVSSYPCRSRVFRAGNHVHYRHKNLKELEVYCAAANQKKLAHSAIAKLKGVA